MLPLHVLHLLPYPPVSLGAPFSIPPHLLSHTLQSLLQLRILLSILFKLRFQLSVFDFQVLDFLEAVLIERCRHLMVEG